MNGTFYEESLYQVPEGIDTITLRFFDGRVNTEKWLFTDSLQSPFKRDIKYGRYYFYIQAEALNMNQNILLQVLQIVYSELYCKGFLNVSYFPTPDFAKNKIFNEYREIMSLTGLDFNFDCSVNALNINSAAIKQYRTTVYSKQPKGGKSKTTIYDRRPNFRKNHQVNYAKIDAMPRPMRFEIRLRYRTCEFLDFSNINGDYNYLMCYVWNCYLARTFGRYFSTLGFLDLNLVQKENPYLYSLWELSYQKGYKFEDYGNLSKRGNVIQYEMGDCEPLI